RNAVAHGIENPGDRERAGKPPVGHVRVLCVDGPNGPVISVDDDGGGFHIAELRHRAEGLGRGDAAGASLEDLAFEPGVTTAAAPTELSGYGVGLGAVRAELQSVGYVVNLSSTPGVGARIVLCPKGTRDGNA